MLDLLKKISEIDLSKLGIDKEVIVIDNGSTDGSRELLDGVSGIRYFYQSNQGKGAAVQHGIKESKGNFILIQDADLEYAPSDFIPMLAIIAELNFSDDIVVYGSRTLPQNKSFKLSRFIPLRKQAISSWLMNQFLTILVFIIFGKFLTDTLTGYKVYPRKFFLNNEIKSKGFEADHEITAKLIRQNYTIVEIPITYSPRTKAEGKKINFLDGLKAIYTFFRFRFTNF